MNPALGIDYVGLTRERVTLTPSPCAKIFLSHMPEQNSEQLLTEFGRRIQRCYGCFIAFHLKDMYLGEEVSFYCENCKDDSMFHFDDFSKLMDPAKLREAEEEHHH